MPQPHDPAPRRWLSLLPLLPLLAVIGWALALGVTYKPGQFAVGPNYISRSGPVNGDRGGIWLIGEGVRNGSWREISTGVELAFQTLRGRVIVVSVPLLLVVQVLALALGRKRP